MRTHLAAALMLPLCVGGCPSSTTPAAATASTAASVETALTAADRLALVYVTLPACGSAGATALCSNPATVATIKADAQAAYDLVQKAKADATQIEAAAAAVDALTAATPAPATSQQ